MSEDIKRLTEARVKAWKAMSEVLATATAEGRAMTGEEVTTFSAAQADLNAAGKDIEARVEFEKLEKTMNAPAPTPGVPSGDPGVPAPDNRAAEHTEAFTRYLRTGHRADILDREFRTDMNTSTTTAGGFLVPPGFLAKLTEVLKFFGGVRSVANIIQTASGQGLVWPVNDDTSNPAVIIAQNVAVSETDLVLSQKTLAAPMWTTGSVRVSRALMQDSAFDLESVLAERFAKRFGRGQNAAFTLGTGLSGGLVSCTSALTGVIDPLAEATVAATIANLLTTLHAVDTAYRQTGRCVWMMNDSSLSKVQKLVDSTGRPLFTPAGAYGTLATGANTQNGMSVPGGADTLLGYPIVINQDLINSFATGAGVPLIFGDFQSGYIVREVIGATAVLRLEERYADTGEVGFIGYDRADGNTDDPSALRCITNHA